MSEPHILPKLTVIYDPYEGMHCRDSEAKGIVDNIIGKFFKDGRNIKVTVATSLLIDNFRLYLHRRKIGVNNIEFKFRDQLLGHDENARLHPWPRGFCDYTERILEKLLDWDK
jgi:hypothetical protein